VVKLVDAEDSKSSDRKVMSVRFRPPAPFATSAACKVCSRFFFVVIFGCYMFSISNRIRKIFCG
jgi:hypothetical protein